MTGVLTATIGVHNPTMCRVLEVQHQGYYQWIQRSPSCREHRLAWLRCKVRAMFNEFKCRYGSPRIAIELKAQGIPCSERLVARIMREEGLRARAARRFRATTNSRHDLPVAPNVLKRQFQVDRPNAVWVGDITYLWTTQGWLYLAVVIDLYARKVVGWSTSRFINVELVCEAFKRAIARRSPAPGLVMHTDRGCQYASHRFRSLLGTSNDTRDNWFVGYTPDMASGVWVGYDDNSKIGLTGGATSAALWTRFAMCASHFHKTSDFIKPDGVVFADIDPETGTLATEDCEADEVIKEVFVKGTEPTETRCSPSFTSHEPPGGRIPSRELPGEEAVEERAPKAKSLWEALFGR